MLSACRVLAEQFVVLGADPAVPDSYRVLDLPPDTTAPDIKRKLHKLRLTVRFRPQLAPQTQAHVVIPSKVCSTN